MESLGRARFSKMVMQDVILRDKANKAVYASLGHAVWAFLGWPLNDAGGDLLGFARDGAATWLHVTDPGMWEVLSYEPTVTEQGVFLRIGGATPLLQAALKHNQLKEIGYAELFDLAAMLGLTMPGNASRAHLLKVITDHASLGCADPADFVREVRALPVHEDTLDLLAKDPLMEAAFDELDATTLRRRGVLVQFGGH